SVTILVLVGIEVIPFGPQVSQGKYLFAPRPTKQHLTAQRAAAGMIPPGAKVRVTNQMGGHLSARRFVYSFPVILPADWVVVDTADQYVGERLNPRRFFRELRSLLGNSRWQLVCGT